MSVRTLPSFRMRSRRTPHPLVSSGTRAPLSCDRGEPSTTFVFHPEHVQVTTVTGAPLWPPSRGFSKKPRAGPRETLSAILLTPPRIVPVPPLRSGLRSHQLRLSLRTPSNNPHQTATIDSLIEPNLPPPSTEAELGCHRSRPPDTSRDGVLTRGPSSPVAGTLACVCAPPGALCIRAGSNQASITCTSGFQ